MELSIEKGYAEKVPDHGYKVQSEGSGTYLIMESCIHKRTLLSTIQRNLFKPGAAKGAGLGKQ